MTRPVGFLRKILFFSTLLFLLAAGSVFAEEETRVDALHRQASVGVLASARWLDNYPPSARRHGTELTI
ncbi:MAG: hypothetical protein RBT64_12970 [Trichloromonas sp.]|nr:hypothetical protein [Trichloromonas sp.]